MKLNYHKKFEQQIAVVAPGEYYVSDEYIINTLLGTCVSVVLYSEEKKIGGLNHYLLPSSGKNELSLAESEAGRYGVYAMEILINELMHRGVTRKEMKAKIFGGGKILAVGIQNEQEHVGIKNVNFVKDFLEKERIPITAEDVGGFGGRKIYFFPWNSRVLVSRIQKSNELILEEKKYEEELKKKKAKTNIFIFDQKKG